MEELGAQVASSMFIHQALGGGLCEPHPMTKKRALAFMIPNIQHQQQPQMNYHHHGRGNWNPNMWDWDSVGFVAKPLPDSDSLRLDNPAPSPPALLEPPRRSGGESTAGRMTDKEYDERLLLKLGGGCTAGGGGGRTSSMEEPVSRPNKRVRSGSPGSGGGGNFPICQVDNCKEDLSSAKDYHRRHKVCELHSKASKALVGQQMQRFCQQCSRFHTLSEFDEGKRSCRRRLAGHNRRRRKTQQEDVPQQLVLTGNHDNNGKANLDLVNLLAVLARAQGSTDVRGTNGPSLPSKEQLIQIFSKLNSLPLPEDFITKLPFSASLNRTMPEQVSSEKQNSLNVNVSSPLTMDLLAVLSATLASSASDGLAAFSQKNSKESDAEKRETTSSSNQSPAGDSECRAQESHASIPLQLFNSTANYTSPPTLSASRKYFSSDSSSNLLEDRSPSSSPPMVQKFFPMQTAREAVKPEHMLSSGEVSDNAEGKGTGDCITSLDLFGGCKSKLAVDSGPRQNFPYQAGYTSSSSSDHSPSSLISDSQDRSGRILFKLFDKDPSQLPGTLRTQIYNWLSLSPSEMESYIKPGCVVLSIYVSMPRSSWKQLEENFLLYVNSLIQKSDSDFWRCGRFLLHAGRHLTFFHDGKVRLSKSLRSLELPELISVSPVAVVGGQETTLLLRGRNLSTISTRIHCTQSSDYTIERNQESARPETLYDEINLVGFRVHTASPSIRGRCFLEVESGGSMGNYFPVIIADASICRELQLLEVELDKEARRYDFSSVDHDVGQTMPREEALHFLNEIGWLFQRQGMSSMPKGPNYSLGRFKFLLVFSVERDLCAVVKTILDILVERHSNNGGLSVESMTMLSEIHLLIRAVKRECRSMIDLLIHYYVLDVDDNSKKYIFLPNLAGPGGVTALHLIACMSRSDDMVDAVTSDPQEIGLYSWNSLLDENGLSPFAYALMRNNESYNRLVAQKILDRKNRQVSVSIESEIEQLCSAVVQEQKPAFQFERGQRSCSRCSVVATKYNRRIMGSQGLLHGPLIHSMLAVAAVCVCVCLFFRGSPNTGAVSPFKWENLDYGAT